MAIGPLLYDLGIFFGMLPGSVFRRKTKLSRLRDENLRRVASFETGPNFVTMREYRLRWIDHMIQQFEEWRNE